MYSIGTFLSLSADGNFLALGFPFKDKVGSTMVFYINGSSYYPLCDEIVGTGYEFGQNMLILQGITISELALLLESFFPQNSTVSGTQHVCQSSPFFA